jgi:DNA-binding NarL/FixJ family response regulator
MVNFRLLTYEDDPGWKAGFEYSIKPKLAAKEINITIVQKIDGATLMQDLELLGPNLIIVDYDLGEQTGEEIIEKIDGDPQYISTSIFFYSGGETIEKLKEISKRFKCGVSCFTKEGEELENAVISKAEHLKRKNILS